METKELVRIQCWFFLAVNGYELEYTQKELSDVILDVANSKKGYEDILAWILKHQV